MRSSTKPPYDFVKAFGYRLFLLTILVGFVFPASTEDSVSLDLTGAYSAIVTVRNFDGSLARGVRYRLSYVTPSKREVLLNEGTPREQKFQFEGVRLIATIAAGSVSDDGKIQLHRLAGLPRTFSLLVGDDGSRPGDFPEGSGILQITFTNPTIRTNLFTLDLPKTVALGERAPDFSVEDIFTHQERTLADFKGKIVVLKFWAPDCPPCLSEMRECNELVLKKKNEWKDGVAFVGVGMDADGERLRKHIQKQGWNEFQHVWAKDTNTAFSSGIAMSYGVRAIPACYVIDRTGLVVWRGNRDNLKELIDYFLNEIQEAEDVQEWLKKIRESANSN